MMPDADSFILHHSKENICQKINAPICLQKNDSLARRAQALCANCDTSRGFIGWCTRFEQKPLLAWRFNLLTFNLCPLTFNLVYPIRTKNNLRVFGAFAVQFFSFILCPLAINLVYPIRTKNNLRALRAWFNLFL